MPTITAADYDAARRLINPDQLQRARAISTTKRRRAAFVAIARDALGAALIQRYALKDFRALTKLLRSDNPTFDFDAAVALFPEEL